MRQGVGGAKNLQERAKRRSKIYGRSPKDGSSSSREMAGKTFSLLIRRIRETKDDPDTTHPLSYEEFDNIPDIGDIEIKEKE